MLTEQNKQELLGVFQGLTSQQIHDRFVAITESDSFGDKSDRAMATADFARNHIKSRQELLTPSDEMEVVTRIRETRTAAPKMS